jgi:hypothetical protein
LAPAEILKMQPLFVASAAGLLALAGCARVVDVVPLNDAARASGIPRMDLTLNGTGYGPATVTMPSGEALTGHHRLALTGASATGFGTASGSRESAFVSGTSTPMPTQGPWTMQAAGNRGTTITCQGSAGGLGHGDALCETNNGSQYQMMF